MGEPLLIVQGLDVHYGGIHALKGVDLRVEKGEIVTLIGANGAGKTTTLRAISGLLTPSGGQVTFNGEIINRVPKAHRKVSVRGVATMVYALWRLGRPAGLPPHKIVERGLAHAPEGRGIFANLTVDENLEIGSYVRRDRAAVRRDREHVLDVFPRLRERLQQNAGTLSGGEQQMLAIGRALLGRPKLLLLDEPSLGLAPTIVKLIFEIIRKINDEGTTILLVEQNAHMALRVAHRAYVLEVGCVVAEDDAKKLAADDKIRKAYLGVHD
jgi:branched-chain amino acid transport system ATP-binding protein